MKNILRNLWVTITRFKMASILNIVGLAIAFAVFSIIMMQSYWELFYNKSIKDSEKIYLFEVASNLSDAKSPFISRPLGENLAKATKIENYAVTWGPGGQRTNIKLLDDNNTEIIALVQSVSESFIDMFDLQQISGDFSKFKQPKTVIISQSLAEKMFGTQNPIGKIIGGDIDTSEVVAVYKNFSENCSFKNSIFTNIGDAYIQKNSEWSFYYYYKISDIEGAKDQLVNECTKFLTTLSDGQTSDFDDVAKAAKLVDLVNFEDIYFKGSDAKGNYALTSILIAIAILIIGIAVINFINFFMALVPVRIRSININKVFGTPTAALRLNIVCETLGIVIIAFFGALMLIQIASQTFITEWINCSLKISDNLLILSATAAIAVIVGLLSGLYPAFYITKFNPMLVLKGSFGRSKTGQRLRTLLVSVQFVISIALIIGSLFMYLQTNYMQNQDMGYNHDRLVTVQVGSVIAKQSQTFVDELMKNPHIEGVVYSDNLVLNVGMGWGRGYNGAGINFMCFPVSWDYPQFMGMELIDGRMFNQDDCSKTNGTIIFNEITAKKYGVKIGDFIGGHSDESAEVVGIVKNFNFRSLKDAVEPIALYEFGSAGWRIPSVANIRISKTADFKEVATYIEQTMKKINPVFPDNLINIVPFDESIEALYAKERKLTSIISLFSLVAIIISLVGVFGLVVFEIQYRRKEIALRKVHGATSKSIPVMINKKFCYIVAVSALIAIPPTYYGVWIWLHGFAYKVTMYWWVALIAVALVLAITVIIVTVQTLKAAYENPIKYLKGE